MKTIGISMGRVDISAAGIYSFDMKRTTRYILLGVLVGMLIVYSFSESHLRKVVGNRMVEGDYALVPDSTIIETFSLGFQSVLADYYLLKAQVFAAERGKYGDLEDMRYFIGLIRLVLDLDPKYIIAASYGNYALSHYWDLMGSYEAIQILKKAWSLNPNNGKIPIDIGFVYYFYSQNSYEAARYFSVAQHYPNAPHWLAWVRDSVLRGDPMTIEVRRDYICGECQTSLDAKQKEYFCKRCELYRILIELDQAAQDYRARFGVPPQRVDDLRTRGFVRYIPPCPHGGAWVMTQDGHVTSTALIDTSNEM